MRKGKDNSRLFMIGGIIAIVLGVIFLGIDFAGHHLTGEDIGTDIVLFVIGAVFIIVSVMTRPCR